MKSKQRSQKSSTKEQPLSPQEKLANAQADYEKWSQVAAKPGLSPAAAAWALGAARSARAEMDLRQKAAAFAEQNPSGETEPAPDLSLSLPPPAKSFVPPTTDSSTGPEISG